MLWKVSSEGPEDGSRLTSYLQLKELVLIKDLAECTAIRGDLSECANELQDPSDTVLDKFSEAPQAGSIHIVEPVGELTSACPAGILTNCICLDGNRWSHLYSAFASRSVRIVYGIDCY